MASRKKTVTKTLISIDWTSSEGDQPFFIDKAPDNPLGYSEPVWAVGVTSRYEKLSSAKSNTRAYLEKGVRLILKKLNKRPKDLRFFVPELGGDTPTSRAEIKEFHVYERPKSKIKALITIKQSDLDFLVDENADTVSTPQPFKELSFSSFGLQKKINLLSSTLKNFDEEIKQFTGKIYNIDLSSEEQKLNGLLVDIEELLEANDISLDFSRRDNIVIGVDERYSVLYFHIDNGGGFKNLLNGLYDFQISENISDRTLEYYSDINKITIDLKKNIRIEGNEILQRLDWEEFLTKYTHRPPVIQFSERRPQSPPPKSTIDYEKLKFQKYPKTQKDVDEESWRVKQREFKAEVKKKRNETTEFVSNNVLGNITKILGAINKMESAYSQFIDRYDLRPLVNAALKCTSIDEKLEDALDKTKEALYTARDITREALRIFNIPVLTFDDLIPTVDVMAELAKQIGKAILEAIKIALLQALKQLLLLLLEACGNPSKLKWGEWGPAKLYKKMEEKGPIGSLGMAAGALGNVALGGAFGGAAATGPDQRFLEDFGLGTSLFGLSAPGSPVGGLAATGLMSAGARDFIRNIQTFLDNDQVQGLLSENVEIFNEISSPIVDFITKAPSVLTTGETVRLLTGNPSKTTIDLIQAIIRETPEQKYPKEFKELLNSKEKITDFFSSLGKIMNEEEIFEEVDRLEELRLDQFGKLCDSDDFALRRQLLEGKDMTPEEIEQQFENSRKRQLQRVEDLSNLLLDEDAFQKSIPPIYCHLDDDGNIVPGIINEDDPSFTYLLDTYLDTTFNSVRMQFSSDMAFYPAALQEDIQPTGDKGFELVPRVIVADVDANNDPIFAINPRFRQLLGEGYSWDNRGKSQEQIEEDEFIEFTEQEGSDKPLKRTVTRALLQDRRDSEQRKTKIRVPITRKQILPGLKEALESIFTQRNLENRSETLYDFENNVINIVLPNKLKGELEKLKTELSQYLVDPTNNANSPFESLRESNQRTALLQEFQNSLNQVVVNEYSVRHETITKRETEGFIPIFEEQVAQSTREDQEASFNLTQQEDCGPDLKLAERIQIIDGRGAVEPEVPEPFLGVDLAKTFVRSDSNINFENFFSQDLEDFVKQTLLERGLDLSGESIDESLQEWYFTNLLKDIFAKGESIYEKNLEDSIVEKVSNPSYARGFLGGTNGLVEALLKDISSKNKSLFKELFNDIFFQLFNNSSKSVFFDSAVISSVNFTAKPKEGCEDPNILGFDDIKQKIKRQYQQNYCIENILPPEDGITPKKDNALEAATSFGTILLLFRIYIVEFLIKAIFVYQYFNFDEADSVLTAFIRDKFVNDIKKRNLQEQTFSILIKQYNNENSENTDRSDVAIDYFLRKEVIFCSEKLDTIIGKPGIEKMKNLLMSSWLPLLEVREALNEENLRNIGQSSNLRDRLAELNSELDGVADIHEDVKVGSKISDILRAVTKTKYDDYINNLISYFNNDSLIINSGFGSDKAKIPLKISANDNRTDLEVPVYYNVPIPTNTGSETANAEGLNTYKDFWSEIFVDSLPQSMKDRLSDFMYFITRKMVLYDFQNDGDPCDLTRPTGGSTNFALAQLVEHIKQKNNLPTFRDWQQINTNNFLDMTFEQLFSYGGYLRTRIWWSAPTLEEDPAGTGVTARSAREVKYRNQPTCLWPQNVFYNQRSDLPLPFEIGLYSQWRPAMTVFVGGITDYLGGVALTQFPTENPDFTAWKESTKDKIEDSKKIKDTLETGLGLNIIQEVANGNIILEKYFRVEEHEREEVSALFERDPMLKDVVGTKGFYNFVKNRLQQNFSLPDRPVSISSISEELTTQSIAGTDIGIIETGDQKTVQVDCGPGIDFEDELQTSPNVPIPDIALKDLFKSIKFGLRLSVVSNPNNQEIKNVSTFDSAEQVEKITKNKSYFITEISENETEEFFVFPVVCMEKSVDMTAGVEELNVDETENSKFPLVELKEELLETKEFKFLFDYCFPLDRMLSLLSVYVNSYSLSKPELNTILDATKDYGYLALTSIYNAGNYRSGAATPSFDVNLSAINNSPDFEAIIKAFLLRAPLLVLKGLTEIVDPNIAISKQIYNIISSSLTDVRSNSVSGCPGSLPAWVTDPSFLITAISLGLLPANVIPFGFGPPVVYPLWGAYLASFRFMEQLFEPEKMKNLKRECLDIQAIDLDIKCK